MLNVQQLNIDLLRPWDMNPRHNDQAVNAVARSIQQFGFNVPILCDPKYRVIAGHTRYKAAQQLGLEHVPVIVLNLSGKQKELFAIAENKTGELADWDKGKLRDILAQYRQEEIDIQSLGLTAEEFRRLTGSQANDDAFIPPSETQTRSKRGQLIHLGRHKLLCGDSRHTSSVKRLFQRRPADHVFAGPPYFNQRAYSHWQDNSSYLQDMSRIAQNCHALLVAGGVITWNIANGCYTHHAHVIHHGGLIENAGFKFLDMIIWVKSGANYGITRHTHIKRTRHYYPVPKWEALLIYQKCGEMPQMTPDAARYMWEHHTDVWDIPPVINQMKNYGHPAVCPVEIPYRSIMSYTEKNALVFEPFGGSGTTLIAAEKAGRTAYLIEKIRCIVTGLWHDGNKQRESEPNSREPKHSRLWPSIMKTIFLASRPIHGICRTLSRPNPRLFLHPTSLSSPREAPPILSGNASPSVCAPLIPEPESSSSSRLPITGLT